MPATTPTKANANLIRAAKNPHFYEIQERYGWDAPAHTAKWAGAMVEALIDAFSSEGYNLIIEGTLRTSAVPLNTATLLRDRGYDVIFADWTEEEREHYQILQEQLAALKSQ